MWQKGQVSDPNLPIERRLYEEALTQLPDSAITNIEGLLSPDTRPTILTTTDDVDISILLDFGKIITGRPHIALSGHGG